MTNKQAYGLGFKAGIGRAIKVIKRLDKEDQAHPDGPSRVILIHQIIEHLKSLNDISEKEPKTDTSEKD